MRLPYPEALLIHLIRGTAVPEGEEDQALHAAAKHGLAPILGSLTNTDGCRELRIHLESRSTIFSHALAVLCAEAKHSGLRMLAYKGPVWGALLYGSPASRAFSDLDVIVDPKDLDRASGLLSSCGYAPERQLLPAQWGVLRRFNYELPFANPERGITVDLHWKWSGIQFPLPLSFNSVWSRKSVVRLWDHEVDAPGLEDTAVIAASHAAKHLWSRLEMIAQLTALMKRDLDWALVDRIAADAAVSRQVGSGFRLAAEMGDLPLPPLPRALALSSRTYPRLRARFENNMILGGRRRTDAGGHELFDIFDRRRDVWKALAGTLFVPTHADWSSAPERGFSHWLTRPFRLLTARAAKRLS